jgi:replication-associated recombination protein RarA
MKIQSLTEKYRPRKLADIRGNERVVSALRSFCKNPCSKAFLLSGPAGTGKTSAAFALAGELGCDLTTTPRECGGLFEVASGELTADSVREMFRTTLAYRPFYGSGWKVLICNEADNRSSQAEFVLLDILENLPPQTVVVFTTNEPEKLSPRFRQRCECHAFKTPVRQHGETASAAELAAQKLIDDVWQSELGHNHSPSLDELDGWRDGGHISFRSVLSALEPMIRAQRDIDAEELAAMKSALPAVPVRGEVLADGQKGGISAPPAPAPRMSVAEVMRKIQTAIGAGDFATAKQLETLLA